MKHSESISNIAKALVKAQSGFSSALKDSKNPFFKSNYADLSACIDACYPSLHENGITLLQPVMLLDNGTSVVTTTLLHESGEFVSGSQPVIVTKPNDPQAYGAAVTYARRFALSAMIGLKTADDDGESLMTRAPAQTAAKSSPSPSPVAQAPAKPALALTPATKQLIAELPKAVEETLPWTTPNETPLDTKAEAPKMTFKKATASGAAKQW